MSAALALPEPAEPLSIGVATLLPDGRLEGPRGFILLDQRVAALLRLLAISAGRVVSRSELQTAVGDISFPAREGCPKLRPVDAAVTALRSVLELLGCSGAGIRTVDGVGYLMKMRKRK